MVKLTRSVTSLAVVSHSFTFFFLLRLRLLLCGVIFFVFRCASFNQFHFHSSYLLVSHFIFVSSLSPCYIDCVHKNVHRTRPSPVDWREERKKEKTTRCDVGCIMSIDFTFVYFTFMSHVYHRMTSSITCIIIMILHINMMKQWHEWQWSLLFDLSPYKCFICSSKCSSSFTDGETVDSDSSSSPDWRIADCFAPVHY